MEKADGFGSTNIGGALYRPDTFALQEKWSRIYFCPSRLMICSIYYLQFAARWPLDPGYVCVQCACALQGKKGTHRSFC